jgi:hypothetical protein
MVHKRAFVGLLLVIALLLPAQLSTAQEQPDFVTLITADEVMIYVKALSVDIGARPTGSEAEIEAGDYVAEQFKSWGYDVTIEEFEAQADEEDEDSPIINSRNVIATREGDNQVIVIGAHIDSVTDGTGAGDNASGVAAILAAAHALADVPVQHTLVFIAFGAEEAGLYGSYDYVEGLGGEIDSVLAMINVDSVGVGTDLNVYAGAEITWGEDEDAAPTIDGGPTWVRDEALALAEQMGLPFKTSPDDTWGGYTGDWSDHYAFVLSDVPIVYFEAWQWWGSDDPWWGQETGEGDVMHTPDDVYESIVPEKVEMASELIAATTYALATDAVTPPAE